MTTSSIAETEKKRADYTEGSIMRAIFMMGFPSTMGFMAQHMYFLINLFWVSRLPEGESAVAAVTFYNSLMMVFFAINSLIGPGSMAIISRRYGERDFERAEKAIKETILLKMVSGILFAVLGLAFMNDTLVILGARGQAYDLASRYGLIMLLFMPIFFSAFSMFTALRSVANPHASMTLQLGSNALNMILDPLMMFGWFGFPAMGIAGAAWATVISFSIVFIVGLYLFTTNRANVRLRIFGGLPLGFDTMWQMIKLGVPAWLAEVSFSFSRLVIVPLIATFGTAVVAAYGVGMQVFMFGAEVLTGLGLGLGALMGQTIGSNKFERAKKTADLSIVTGIVVMTFLAAIVGFGAELIASLFFQDPIAIKEAVSLLRISAIGFPFFGAYMMMVCVYIGVGDNRPVMIISFIYSWVFQVLPIVVAIKFLGTSQTVIWWILSAACLASVALFYRYYRKGKWLTATV